MASGGVTPSRRPTTATEQRPAPNPSKESADGPLSPGNPLYERAMIDNDIGMRPRAGDRS